MRKRRKVEEVERDDGKEITDGVGRRSGGARALGMERVQQRAKSLKVV